MTDKQIVYYKKDCLNEPYCSLGKVIEQLNQLKAENDTLRQFLSKEPLALRALQSGYASYKKSSDVFYEMVKQYKQTFTEIKEIAENVQSFVDIHLEDDVYTEMDKILQKISEVKDDR